jgi:predicted aspartyl protease
MPSFTQRIQNLQQIGPVVEILLTPSVPYMQSMGINIATIKDRVVKVLAMIDTGATGTVISKGITEKLGINPVGTILINTPSHTDVSCYQFDAQIVFPNNVAIPSIVVTEAPLQGQHIQCLIGRVFCNTAFLFTRVTIILSRYHFSITANHHRSSFPILFSHHFLLQFQPKSCYFPPLSTNKTPCYRCSTASPFCFFVCVAFRSQPPRNPAIRL